MRKLIGILLVLVVIASVVEIRANDVKARGRCRRIFRDRKNVVVQFMNEEDAAIFAKDLYNYLNND